MPTQGHQKRIERSQLRISSHCRPSKNSKGNDAADLSRRRLTVAHVCFVAPDCQWQSSRAIKGSNEGVHLDGVCKRRTQALRLHASNFLCLEGRCFECKHNGR